MSKSNAAVRRRISVADVKASFDLSSGKELFYVTWFARPLSNYCTPFFCNLGCSANAVTLSRAIITFGVLAGLSAGSPPVLVGVVLAVYVGFVLDCVDGNLARLYNSATYWGKFVDGLVDALYGMLVPLATAIGLWRVGDNGLALLAGSLTTALALSAEVGRNRMSFFREWMITQTGPLTASDEAARVMPHRVERGIVSVVYNSLFFAPLLLLLPNGASYFLVALVLIQAPASIFWVMLIMIQANAILRRGRRSVHAVAHSVGRHGAV